VKRKLLFQRALRFSNRSAYVPVVEDLVPVFALSPFFVLVVPKPSLGAAVKSGWDFDLFVNEASESIV